MNVLPRHSHADGFDAVLRCGRDQDQVARDVGDQRQRAQKIAGIQEAIERGTYDIGALLVADALIRYALRTSIDDGPTAEVSSCTEPVPRSKP